MEKNSTPVGKLIWTLVKRNQIETLKKEGSFLYIYYVLHTHTQTKILI